MEGSDSRASRFLVGLVASLLLVLVPAREAAGQGPHPLTPLEEGDSRFTPCGLLLGIRGRLADHQSLTPEAPINPDLHSHGDRLFTPFALEGLKIILFEVANGPEILEVFLKRVGIFQSRDLYRVGGINGVIRKYLYFKGDGKHFDPNFLGFRLIREAGRDPLTAEPIQPARHPDPEMALYFRESFSDRLDPEKGGARELRPMDAISTTHREQERAERLMLDLAVAGIAQRLVIEKNGEFDAVSVNVLEQIFVEANQIFRYYRGRLLEDDRSVSQAIEVLLSEKSVAGTFDTVPRPWLGLPLLQALDGVPLAGLIKEGHDRLFEYLNSLRRLRVQRVTPDQVPPGNQPIEGTVGLRFLSADPYGLADVAQKRMDDFLRPGISVAEVFSNKFLLDTGKAFPEFHALLVEDSITNKYALYDVGAKAQLSLFGELLDVEAFKKINQHALLYSLLNGQASAFVTEDGPLQKEWEAWRHEMLSLAGLFDEANLPNREEIERFESFLMQEAVGRGTTDYTDAVEAQYPEIKEIRSDYERRFLRLFEINPRISLSVARHPESVRAHLVSLFQKTYFMNAGQLFQMEHSFNSFTQLQREGYTQKDITQILLRALLAYLALPDASVPPGFAGTRRITSENLEQWNALHEIFLKTASDAPENIRISGDQAALDWALWVARKYQIPVSDEGTEWLDPRAPAETPRMTRLLPEARDTLLKVHIARYSGRSAVAHYRIVDEVVSSRLNPSEYAVLERSIFKFAYLDFYAAVLYRDIEARILGEASERGDAQVAEAVQYWCKLMARVYTTLENSNEFVRFASRESSSGREVRLNLFELTRAVQDPTRSLEELLTASVVMRRIVIGGKVESYQIRIP